jgi:hypothetical protein
VFGWLAWAKAYAGFMRPSLWDRAVAPELAAQPMRVAMVGARIATHMTSAMPQTFANPMVDVALFPMTQPIDRIVAGLNAYQLLALMGYPSMLARLGVPDPAVEVHRVDRLERQPTGKVRRFRPLTGAVEVAR